MSFDDAQDAIESRFKTSWGSTSKVVYENTEWPDPKKEDEFVALTVVESVGQLIELRQQALTRYSGTIILQVFVTQGKGTGKTSALADAFGEIFRRAEFSKGSSGLIRCRIPDKLPVGTTNGWYQTNVRCAYIRDVYQSRAS